MEKKKASLSFYETHLDIFIEEVFSNLDIFIGGFLSMYEQK